MKLLLVMSIALLLALPADGPAQTPVAADSVGIPGGDSYRFFDRPVDPDLYLIRPGDELKVTFIDTELDSLVLRVDPEGRITNSTLGVFNLADKTLTEAREALTQTLTRLYNVPEIAVSITKPSKVGITVSGAVNDPGLYTVYTSQRVTEVIDSAGGIQPEGSSRWVLLRGGPKEIPVDLDRSKYLGDDTNNPCLYAGYTVHVPAKSNRRVQVVGEVNNPREIELLRRDDLDLLLALAGGPRSLADLDSIKLIRGSTSEPYTDQEIQSGDVVLVPSEVSETAQHKITVFGAVSRPGRYPFETGLTLADVVSQAGGFSAKAGDNPQAVIFRRAIVDQWGRASKTRFPISGDTRQMKTIVLRPSDSVFVPSAVGYVRVGGAVRNPGYFPYQSGQSAVHYITVAGGYLPAADQELVEIYDRISRITETFAPEVTVHDGDEIVVRIREELQ